MLDAEVVRGRVAAAAALDPEVIDEMIAEAQAFIEQQTDRYFGLPEAVVQYQPGSGTFELTLADHLQTGTPTVTERTGPTAAAVAVTGFELRPGRVATRLLRTDGFPWRQSYEYKVSYTRGYALGAAPADVRRVALELIALRLNLLGREGLRSESLGEYSFTRFGDGDLDAIDGARPTLRAWRRMVLA